MSSQVSQQVPHHLFLLVQLFQRPLDLLSDDVVLRADAAIEVLRQSEGVPHGLDLEEQDPMLAVDDQNVERSTLEGAFKVAWPGERGQVWFGGRSFLEGCIGMGMSSPS